MEHSHSTAQQPREHARRLIRLQPPMTLGRAFHVLGRQQWAPGLSYLLLDILAWSLIFQGAVFLRRPGGPDHRWR